MVRTLSKIGLLVLVLGGLFGLGAGLAWAADPVDLKMYLDGPAQVAIGQAGVYTFQVNSPGTSGAASVRVVLTLPAGLTWESAEPGAIGCVTPPGKPGCGRNSGPCVPDTARGVVTCTVDQPDDPFFSYTATVRFAASLVPGTALPVTAAVTAGGDDPTPADNTKTVITTAILGSDLSVTAVPPARAVKAGQPVRYTLIVHNAGPAPATSFNLRESMSDDWYTGGTVTTGGGDCFPDLDELTCDFTTTLAPGADLRLEHVLRSRADTTRVGKTTSIRAEITDSINPANNVVHFSFRFAPKAGTPSSTPAGHPPTATGPVAGGGLPITGPATLPLAAGGLLLLLAGAGAVALGRRR